MKILCIGDSFTAGLGVDSNSNWVALADSLSKNHEFINKGINGDTTSGMLARLESDVISLRPDIALVIGGSNDIISAGNLDIPKNNIMAIVHRLFHYRIKPIISFPVPCVPEDIMPLWKNFNSFETYNKQLSQLNQWGKKFSKAFLCGYIDIYSSFAEKANTSDFYLDGLHLQPKGHELVADLVVNYLAIK